MKILVLGGNGFIGSHVADALLASGHAVRVFDRAQDRYRGCLPGVEYVIGSFDDALSLAEALTGVDVVFHGISTTVPSTSNLDPVSDIQSNLIGTVRLLRAMLDQGVRRIVFLSSGGTVYGPTEVEPIPEDHPLRPACSYGVVKVAIENYLEMYRRTGGLRPVVLRPSNPYGERQGHVGVQGVVGTFLTKMAKGEPIEIWGDGTVVRDFIYVGDLADLCAKVIASDLCGVFNVGGGSGHSINEIYDCVAAVAGVGTGPVYRPGRSFDVSRVVLDCSRAAAAFGWRPATPLSEGIARTAAWLAACAAD